MDTVQQILSFVQTQPLALGLLILMFSAMIEYIFPPFPGDTVTLVGAALIPAANWPWYGVLISVVVGSVLGAMLDWRVGVWVHQNAERDTWLHRWLKRPGVEPRIRKITHHFAQRGAAYIALNRFLPAFRGLFFIAAGMADLSARKVAFWATVSALGWNAGILALGVAVGYNLEALVHFVDSYTTIVLFLVVCVVFLMWIVGRLRAQNEDVE